MASSDHIASSDFIKSVHQQLREESKLVGAEEAWQKHCQNEEILKRYASAMRNLASNHWEANYAKNTQATSRVEWVHRYCQLYFSTEEIYKHRQREIEIAHKINLDMDSVQLDVPLKNLKLLDVGSCYNPFKKYNCYDVLPIDIAPATEDVYKCDFINLTVTSTVCDNSDVYKREISELQSDSIEIVVFSLLLEYLPSPNQRVLCCKKAYELLKPEGILIIITPDSKHVGANAKIMKSWRFILAKIGLSRIKYEKLAHLHCMVFRKSLKLKIAERWVTLQDETQFYEDFVIPQDFKKIVESTVRENNDCCDFTLFEELPNSAD